MKDMKTIKTTKKININYILNLKNDFNKIKKCIIQNIKARNINSIIVKYNLENNLDILYEIYMKL